MLNRFPISFMAEVLRMSDDSTFNADVFLTQETVGANDTKFDPVPENEYIGLIEKLVVRELKFDDGRKQVVADLTWKIQANDDLKAQMNMDEIRVRQSLFLDREPNGALSTGKNKNVSLGKLRDALGQNDPTRAWFLKMLEGAGPARIRTKNAPDKKNPDNIYSNVVAVAAL